VAVQTDFSAFKNSFLLSVVIELFQS